MSRVPPAIASTATAEWVGVEFTVIDTGGLMDDDEIWATDPEATETYIAQQTRSQASAAIAEADVIVFMVDITTDPTAGDAEIATLLRRARQADDPGRRTRPIVPNAANWPYEFYELGLGEPIGVSAYHGNGTGDLLDKIVENLPDAEEEDESSRDRGLRS